MEKYIVIVKNQKGQYEVKSFENEMAYNSFKSEIRNALIDLGLSIEETFMIPFSRSYAFEDVMSVCKAFARGKIEKEELEKELEEFKA